MMSVARVVAWRFGDFSAQIPMRTSHNPAKKIMSSCTTHHNDDSKMSSLEEDVIDEILYLARANEAAELTSYLTELSAQTKRSSADLVAAAIDPYSKNGALHYAAANGHNGA